MNRIDFKQLLFLDGLRGLAALYVMIGHARWLLWEGYTSYLKNIQDYTILEKCQVYFFSVFKYGHEAVLFFFVLSGFVIHLKYALRIHSLKENAVFDFWNYLFRRIKRIYPPFLFAILFTYLLDKIGILLGYKIYDSNTVYSLINASIEPIHDFGTLIGNVLFLIRVYVPEWGTNGPFWSLMYEWWFYMFYPILFWFSRKSILLATVIVFGLFLFSLFIPSSEYLILPIKVFGLLVAWWSGALLADVYVGRIRLSMKMLIPLIILIPLVLLFSSTWIIDARIKENILAFGFVGLLSLCFVLKLQPRNFLLPLEKLKWLGDLSYTLYIIHFPLFVLFSGYLMNDANGQLPNHFGFVWIGIFLSLIVAYCLHHLIEKPFITRKIK